jgi:hypothetical protein
MILTLFKDAARILLGRFVLIYPLLGFSMLLGLLFPHTTPAPELRWALWGALLFLIYMAFSAGWVRMCQMAIADWVVQRIQQQPLAYKIPPGLLVSTTGLLPKVRNGKLAIMPSAFGTLSGFFPGVGQYFGAFALGGLLHIAGALLIIVLTGLWINALGGLPAFFQPLLHATPQVANRLLDPATMQAGLLQLSAPQQAHVQQFILALLSAGLAYGVFSLLTMFWPALVVFGNYSPLKAYGQSALLLLKYPLLVFAIGALYVVLSYLTTMGMQVDGPVTGAISQFFALTSHMYIEVLLCLTVVFHLGKEAASKLVDHPSAETPLVVDASQATPPQPN